MKRRGTSLLEMMTVITLVTLVMALGATLLTSLVRLQRQVASDLAQRNALSRLAARFRQDAHAASEVQQAQQSLQFTMGQKQRIEYALDGPSMRRLVWEEDQLRHRESFEFPAESSIRLEIQESEPRHNPLARIVLGQRDAAEPRPGQMIPLPARIEAAVGVGIVETVPEEREP